MRALLEYSISTSRLYILKKTPEGLGSAFITRTASRRQCTRAVAQTLRTPGALSTTWTDGLCAWPTRFPVLGLRPRGFCWCRKQCLASLISKTRPFHPDQRRGATSWSTPTASMQTPSEGPFLCGCTTHALLAPSRRENSPSDTPPQGSAGPQFQVHAACLSRHSRQVRPGRATTARRLGQRSRPQSRQWLRQHPALRLTGAARWRQGSALKCRRTCAHRQQ